MTHKLSWFERKVLENQFRILYEQTKDSQYLKSAEILEKGYSTFYEQALGYYFENASQKEVEEETMNILDMFRNISYSIDSLSESEKKELDLNYLKFQWFDWNNDDHHGFLIFLVETMHRYEEVKIFNSHNRWTLPMYRRMLINHKRFSSEGKSSNTLTLSQLKEIILSITV